MSDTTQATLPTFFAGNTVTYDVVFTDSNGDPIDISNDILFMTLKHEVSDADGDAVLQVQHTFPADAESVAGRGVFTLESTDTAGLEAKCYVFDFQRVVPGTDPLEVYTLTQGSVSVKKRVTIATS